MSRFILLLLMIACFSATSCLKDKVDDMVEAAEELDEELNGEKGSSMDITDALGLYFSEGKTTSGKKMFKITAEGTEEVKFTDEKGKTRVPTSVFKASDELLIVWFDNDFFLVKKSNGSMSELPLAKLINGGFLSLQGKSAQDSKGNIYFKVYGNAQGRTCIVKIDISNYTLSVITPDSHWPVDFLIDNADNIYYCTNPENHGNIYYCFTASGMVYKLDIDRYWKVSRGDIYAFKREYNGESLDFILKVNVGDGGITFENIGHNFDYYLTEFGYVINNRDYGIYLHYGDNDKTQVFDMTDKNNIVKKIYKGTLLQTHFDGKYVYSLLKDEDFEKFNPVNGEFTTIWKNDPDLEIYGDINLSEDGTVNFSAFKLSIRKNVLAQIDAQGNFSIIESLSEDDKIIYIDKF